MIDDYKMEASKGEKTKKWNMSLSFLFFRGGENPDKRRR